MIFHHFITGEKETTLKDKIYTIRGQKVMLDFDLAGNPALILS